MSKIADQFSHAIRLREVTPGRPEDGPYPSTLDEVADEVVAWLRNLDLTSARGVAYAVLYRLTRRGDLTNDTPPPPLDAAVQILRGSGVPLATEATARRVVSALACAGWLHDPAELARERERWIAGETELETELLAAHDRKET